MHAAGIDADSVATAARQRVAVSVRASAGPTAGFEGRRRGTSDHAVSGAPMRRRLTLLAMTGAAAVLLAGCARLDEPEVERVAATFATGGPAVRCALLAAATHKAVETTEGAGCVAAIGRLQPSVGEVRSVSVWGDQAQAQLADDTLFLTRTGGGWKVVAAGCTPNGDRPYQCQVDGP
jgi:hypothetical protein